MKNKIDKEGARGRIPNMFPFGDPDYETLPIKEVYNAALPKLSTEGMGRIIIVGTAGEDNTHLEQWLNDPRL